MIIHRALAPAAIASLLLAPSLAAQDRGKECIRAYNDVVMGNPEFAQLDTTLDNGCQLVAVALEQQWSSAELFGVRPDPEDVAATRGQTTIIPGEAAPSIEPVEAAGGSVAAVGTDDGAGALAALALNPSVFFVNPADVQAVARWSRFTDVTLLVPVQEATGRRDGDASPDFVGLRWGINLTGPGRGSTLYEQVVRAYDAFNARSTPAIAGVRDLLLTGARLEPCIRTLTEKHSLDEADRATITQLCGGLPIVDYGATAAALREALRRARIQADSKYLGVDLRADFGDLTLPSVDTVRGTSLFAGLGAGRRFAFRENSTTGIRGHLGLRYWDPEGAAGALNSIEGGAAFEAIRYYNLQRLALLGGVDFRYRTNEDERSGDERTTMSVRASLNVPVAPTTSVTINLAVPVAGDLIGPTVSIKLNWRLLWSRAF